MTTETMLEMEGVVEEMYESHGLDPAWPQGPVELAKRVLKREEDLIIYKPRHVIGEPDAVLWAASRQIWVADDLGAFREAFAIYHEVNEYQLDRICYEKPDREEVANYMAGASMAPRPAFKRVLAECGRRMPRISFALKMSMTAAALRFGEVTGTPTAVITPTSLRVRGEPFVWGSLPDLWKIVGAKGARQFEIVRLGYCRYMLTPRE